MKFAVYQPANGGKIRMHVFCPPDQILGDILDGEEIYPDCPTEATHIINGKPVVLPRLLLTTEQLLEQVRLMRNIKLTACDWTQMPDTPLSTEQRAAWATYRQQLRDFPSTCDPAAPVWPTPPA